MSKRRTSLPPVPRVRVSRTVIDVNIRGGGPSHPPIRIEDIPVNELEQTGSQPIFNEVASNTGALPQQPRPAKPPKPPTALDAIISDEVERMQEIAIWWEAEAGKDADACLSKLIEYGSSDFDIMAHSMLAVGGAVWEGIPDADRMRVGREMAIAFYLQGKIGRAFGAFEKGRMPSDDTLDDIVRYGMMWKRIRQTGAWK
jgi:hypothetical protein